MLGIAVEPNSSVRKWGFRTALVLLLGVLAVAAYQGPLWMELSYAAQEAFPSDENWESKLLRVDVDQNLRQYSPQRLAQNLYSPSEKWRAVVCLALRNHPDKAQDAWVGVPGSLMRAGASSTNPGLKKLVRQVFLVAPGYSATDVQQTLAALEKEESSEDETILEAIAQRGPENMAPIQATMFRWLDGDAGARRDTAFQMLVRYFPETDEATSKKIRSIFSADGGDDLPWHPLHLLIARQPKLGESLLAGGPQDQRILLRAMRTKLVTRSDDPILLRAVQDLAVKQLQNADETTVDLFIDFLVRDSKGVSALLEAMQKRNDAFVVRVVAKLPRATAAAADEAFTALKDTEADAFVRLLPRLDGRARRRWGEWFMSAGTPRTAKLFPTDAGPNSPKHADLLSPLLNDDDEALWVQWYFERVAPLQAKQATVVVGLLRRSLNPQQRGNRGGAAGMAAAARRVPRGAPPEPALPTTTHLRYAIDLQRRFAANEEVKAFFRDFPSVAVRVAKELESEAKKPASKSS